ncbi:MAG: F0F1 ATP synthase subunit delta [Zoogloeaceae bacterium]|jgi:F-type H+-transporting ATPase subunit delta|nr:F0F1 ATP synthase subunit delta [Zoogloeaceae bacterium]
MAETLTLARPYAEAAFEAARESGTLAAWSERLARLAAVVADHDAAAVIDDPRLSGAQLVEFVGSLLGDEASELKNFVAALVDNDRLSLAPEIASLFEAKKAAAQGIEKAEIASAFTLSDAELKALLPKLEAHFKVKLDCALSVDPALIGGVKVTVGDRVLDASVRGKLDAMASALKN